MDDNIFLAAFHNGLSSDLFIHKLYDREPQIMAELIHSAQSFMNVKDAITVKRKKKAKRAKVGYTHHLEQGLHPKKVKTKEKKTKKAGK